MEYDKKVWAWRQINPHLVRWLEGRCPRSKLTRLERLVKEPFTRWKLVGIQDCQLVEAPTKERSLFYYITPSLEYLFGEDFLGVCRKYGENDLILDFKSPETLFRKFTRQDLEEAEKMSWHPGESWIRKQHTPVRIIV